MVGRNQRRQHRAADRKSEQRATHHKVDPQAHGLSRTGCVDR